MLAKLTKQLNKYTNNAKEEDVEHINKKIDNMNRGALKNIWCKVVALYKLIQDVDAPFSSKAIAIGALVYVISPIDLVPDFIPFAGLVDDATIVGIAINQLNEAIKPYMSNDCK